MPRRRSTPLALGRPSHQVSRGKAPKARATGIEITKVMKYDAAATGVLLLLANADLTYRITAQSGGGHP